MKIISLFLFGSLGFLSLFLTGCASIVDGVNQSVSVETTPAHNANCALTSDKGRWYVNSTPGSVVIHRSFSDMLIECKKEGYESIAMPVKSHAKPLIFGNIIFGGVIGVIIDFVTGAGFDYPNNIQVPMLPKKK